MNRVLLLIVIALFTYGIVMLASRPDIVKEFWLWVVGLAGFIVRTGVIVFEKIKELFFTGTPGKTDEEIKYYEQKAARTNESVG